MPKSGPRVKYGYIIKDNIKPTDTVVSFYKSINLAKRIDNDLDIDPFNRNYLRIEIPPDMKTMIHEDIEHDHRIYMVLKKYQRQVKDLNPTIVYRVIGRGFRKNEILTRYYKENKVEDVKDIFYNRVELEGRGRRREV